MTQFAIYLVRSDSVILHRYPGLYATKEDAREGLESLIARGFRRSNCTSFDILPWDPYWDTGFGRKGGT